jgi:hypothetical protein
MQPAPRQAGSFLPGHPRTRAPLASAAGPGADEDLVHPPVLLGREAAGAHGDIGDDEAADTIYAIAANESAYLRLTGECGWTDARYAQLVATTLQAALGAVTPS